MSNSTLSAVVNSQVARAWRAGVKALGLKQGPALEDALVQWIIANQKEIDRSMSPVRDVPVCKDPKIHSIR